MTSFKFIKVKRTTVIFLEETPAISFGRRQRFESDDIYIFLTVVDLAKYFLNF